MYIYFNIEDIEDIDQIHILHKCKNKRKYIYCDNNSIVSFKEIGINPKKDDITLFRKIKIPNNTDYLYILYTKSEEERGWSRIYCLEYFFDSQSMLDHIKEFHMSTRECPCCDDDTCEYCIEMKTDYNTFLKEKELDYCNNPDIIYHTYRRVKIKK